MTKRTDAAIIDDLRDVNCNLSPECLACDGEADPVWVRKRYTDLTNQRDRLLRELGREPTSAELYGH